MTFITLPQSGEIIDLDSVAFVVKGGAGAVGEIKVGVGGSKISFVLGNARRFLELFRDHKGVNVEVFLRRINPQR